MFFGGAGDVRGAKCSLSSLFFPTLAPYCHRPPSVCQKIENKKIFGHKKKEKIRNQEKSETDTQQKSRKTFENQESPKNTGLWSCEWVNACVDQPL